MLKINRQYYGFICLVVLGLTTGCNAQVEPKQNTAALESKSTSAQNLQRYQIQPIADFNEPWALAELPDGRLLITEKAGKLKLFDPKTGQSLDVQAIPEVAYGGQGGLGDVILDPEFQQNQQIYLSYAEVGTGGYGAVVIRGKLVLDAKPTPKLTQIQRIWQQVPKVSGQGHYAHRIKFGADGKLWISSGERQKFEPAQDLKSNLGKILCLNADGTTPLDNPFQTHGEIAKQVWSLGHRNPLGMAFDSTGQLWVAEMGPKGGDELNLIAKGENYGYPLVSNGDHYNGLPIPDHATRPEFTAPVLDWTPVISPSSLMFYTGDVFPHWKHKAILGGLSSKAIIVVDTQAQPVRELQRIEMGQRIRGVLQAQDGNIWVIEDGQSARLLKLVAP